MRVLITGASSGLGLATCKYFLQKGAVVATLGRSAIPSVKPNLVLEADIRNEEEVSAAMDRIRQQFERLDLLVNCAGIGRAYLTYNHHRQRHHSMNDFKEVMEVNVNGTFNVIRLACQLLACPSDEERSSLIVMTSSIAAFDGQIGQAAYAASKGAIASMTLPLARELSNVNIRVCTIAPGPMDTPMLEMLPEKARRLLAKMTPYPKRLGRGDEFAKLVDAIYDNQFLNGEIIRLDGGLRLQP